MKLIKHHKGIIRLWKQLIIIWVLILVAKAVDAQWSDNPLENNAVATLAESNQFSPVIAKDGLGGVIIAWEDNRKGNFDIFARRIHPSGQLFWTDNGEPGKPIAINMSSQESPSIVEGLLGDFFIAWQDNRNESSEKEIFVQKFAIDDEQPLQIWNPETRAHRGNNSSPLIIRNGSFGVITASYISRLFDDLISYQFINNEGSPRFTPQEIVSDNAKGIQPDQPPAVVSGLDGGLIATWVDTRNSLPAIYAKGIKRDGVSAWMAGEVLVSSTITDQTHPVALSDGKGGAIIAWINRLNGLQDNIKVQRLNVDGNPQWATGGIVISSIKDKKRNIKITSDGQNGAYILWENLTGTNWKLNAQRIFNNGKFWPNDLRLSLSSGDQTNAAIIGDGRGQAIAAWEDNRNGNLDIYAQKIDSLGIVRPWGDGDDGLAISIAANAQRNPVLVDDEFAGAIIAWEDLRNINDRDIYAQKVSGPGILGEIRSITVKSPNGGENWEIGSTRIISWEWTGEIEQVVIEVSNNEGRNWQEIPFGTGTNNGFREWLINKESSEQWQLRISDRNFNFINDKSDRTFTISNAQGPTIQHTQISQATYGDSLLISAEVRDLSGVAEVFLNYRQGGAQDFVPIAMLPDSGDNFSSVIPANSLTERGLEYYISSIDSINQDSNTDTFFVSVNFGSGVQTAQISGGTSQSAYRMISSPNLLEKTFIDSIFSASGFGAIDTTSWRVFLYQDTGYVELDSMIFEDATFTFKPGEAFWLISDRDRMIDYGSGVSLRSDTIFTMTLEPGWNQIGLPFAFPVAWNSIFTTSGEPDVEMPWLYTGSYAIADTLEPFEGYFVLNRSNNRIDLKIPPIAAEASGEPLARLNLSHANWALQIKATCQEALDDFNFLGVYEQASDSWDALDHTEPPPIGDYVSVYFPHKDWRVHPNNYTTDFRTTVANGQTWSFIVNTNIRSSEAKVVIMGIETLPHDLEIILLDEKLNISQDLRENNVFVFPTGAYGISKNLKILVGNREFLAEETSDKTLVPENFVLSQNFPNPFNPVTSIRFGLPRAEKVRIQVFDILGKEVTTLIDNEQKQAGYHLVSWNSKDKYGSEVASGLYIYRLQAGKFSQTKKMLLIQ